MDTDDANPTSSKPLQKERSLFASATLLKNPDRPAIFDLLFWSILAMIYAFRVFAPQIQVRGIGLAPMTAVCAALVAVWLVLPWSPYATSFRKCAAPAFLLATTAMLFASDLIWALGLYPIAFANAVFLFGLWRGVAYSAAALFALFVPAFIRSVSGTAGSSPETVIQRWAVIILLSVVCMGLSATVIEARRSRERAKDLYADLESAYAELGHYAERVRELTLSEERARMSREIHDSVGHHLTAVKLQAEAAVKMAEKRPQEARAQMERARDLAAQAYEEVRRSVRALGPPPLGERSGAGAMRALVRSFEGTGFEISFRLEGDERVLPEEADLVLYRALQEGLTNAVRHSNARRINASLSYGGEAVKLAVTDDGQGASGKAGAMREGFGLHALEERVGALGGVFAAGNTQVGGFAIEVELPVEEPFGGTCRPTGETP
ncbi:MAG TPA: sensor histidine kinase [Rubrobacteraceae bacterium]|nr:sensor histidine kinase [Rubrobacteraceae bacterium]